MFVKRKITENVYVMVPQRLNDMAKAELYVAEIENVLELYHLPYDPKHPMVCIDQQPVQLIKETRNPLAAKAGHPEAVDYQYERLG